MGMSTSVIGVRDLDGKFATMIQLKHLCESAGVSHPPEVTEYFGGEEHMDDGDLRRMMEEVDISNATTTIRRESVDGFQVDLSRLPEGVRAIRFENRY